MGASMTSLPNEPKGTGEGNYFLYASSLKFNFKDVDGIIQLFGHSISMWYAMSPSLVNLTEVGTGYGRG